MSNDPFRRSLTKDAWFAIEQADFDLEAMMRSNWRKRPRRYRVSGVDDKGAVHAFESDDPNVVSEAQRKFADSLTDVEIEDRGAT